MAENQNYGERWFRLGRNTISLPSHIPTTSSSFAEVVSSTSRPFVDYDQFVQREEFEESNGGSRRNKTMMEKVQEILADNQILSNCPPQLIASGKSIKQLIMVPFTNQPINMLAHRIGNTIYVDNLESDKTNESQSTSRQIPTLSRSPDDQKQLQLSNSLVAQAFVNSSFSNGPEWLSIANSPPTEVDIWNLTNAVSLCNFGSGSVTESGHANQHPKSLSYKISTENGGASAHLWEFSNLRMLVDHDIPVIGGEDLPTISIRMNEERPISILSGMDMWLDQMIKGLDGVVVVHHGKGHTKEYKLHHASELPALQGSEFEPSDLANVIENVYKFLDEKMTEQGHTYYLHRESGSDDLTLYDMTAMFPDLATNNEYNPSLSIVACALMRQAAELLNHDDPPPLNAVEVAHKMLQSAMKIIKTDQLPHIAASIAYLLAASFQSIELPFEQKAHESALVRATRNLCGLESILIERNPQISSSIPLDALRSAVAVCDDDEEEDSNMRETAPRTCMPGIHDPISCLRSALVHIEEGMEFLVDVEEDRQTSARHKARVPVFAVGVDDEVTMKLEKKKQRPGSDVDLLRSLLYVRCAACLHRVSLLFADFFSTLDDKSTAFLPSTEESYRCALVFELSKTGLAACAEVLRLQSSGRTRTAATVQASSLLKMIIQTVHSLGQLDAADLSERLSQVCSDDSFIKKRMSRLSIPESSPLWPVMELTEDVLSNEEAREHWLLDMGSKFRTVLTKYTKEADELTTRLFKTHYNMASIRCSIAVAMMQAADIHRDRGAAISGEDSTRCAIEFKRAVSFYEIGMKHLDVVLRRFDSPPPLGPAYRPTTPPAAEMMLVGDLHVAMAHNCAAMRRGLCQLEMDKEGARPGKQVDEAVREAKLAYYNLEEHLRYFQGSNSHLRLQTVLADTLSFLSKVYWFHFSHRTRARSVKPRHSIFLDECVDVYYRLCNLDALPEQLLIKSASILFDMLINDLRNLLIIGVNDENDVRTLVRARSRIILEVTTKCDSLDVVNRSFTGQCIADCLSIIAQATDFRRMVCGIDVLLHLPSSLLACTEFDAKEIVDSAMTLVAKLLMVLLSLKKSDGQPQCFGEIGTKLKEMANLVLRRPKVDDEQWIQKSDVLQRSLREKWPFEDTVPRGRTGSIRH